jgi:hypothetical protein
MAGAKIPESGSGSCPSALRCALDERGEDYRGWPLWPRLELLAFDAQLAEVPPALLGGIWEAIDRLGRRTSIT